MPRYPLLPNYTFRETFESQQSVAQNGGVITGTPAISNGVTLDGSAQYVTYTKNLYGIKTVSVKMNVTSTTARLVDLDGGTHYLWINAGTVTAQGFASPTIYIDGVATSTITTGLHTITVTTATAFNGVNVVVGKVGANYGAGIFYDVSIFTSAFSTDEALDLYQNDTITEIDALKALVHLPLKSWYNKEQTYTIGSELLADGNMEAAGTGSWGSGAATLSKQTTSPHGGTQCLRVARTAPGWGYAKQSSLMTVGGTYKFTGWARSDGTELPKITDEAGTVRWTGTTSTSWQYFDVTFIAANGNPIFGSNSATSSGYVEFDDLSVKSNNSLSDLDMEVSGVSSWGVAGGGTTLTKSSASPHSGTQALRVTGGAAQYATQTVSVVGKRYKITGWGRGDGTSNPEVRFGSVVIWSGTSSTSWQYFDCEGVFATNGTIYFYTNGGAGSNWVEFDDLSFQLMESRTDNIGSLGGYALLGDGSTPAGMPTFTALNKMTLNGSKYLSIPTINAALLGNSGTLIMFVKLTSVAAGTHAIMLFGEPAAYSSGFLMSQNGASLYAYWKSAPVTISNDNSLVVGVWQMLAIVNNGGTVYAVVDDSWSSSGSSGGSISGNQNLYIGGAAATFAGITGDVMPPIVYPFALTATQLRYVRKKLLNTLNT